MSREIIESENASKDLATNRLQDREQNLLQWKQTVNIATQAALISHIGLWTLVGVFVNARPDIQRHSFGVAVLGPFLFALFAAVCSLPIAFPIGIAGALVADVLYRKTAISVPKAAIALTIILEITITGWLLVFAATQ